MSQPFREITHTADLAIEVHGRTLAELFVHAAQGMFSLMADLETLKPTVSHDVLLHSFDLETLLIDWLNELLFLHESEGQLYSHFTIHSLSPTELRATVRGRPAPVTKSSIKAATFHNLSITQVADGYVATIVFDV